MAMLARHALGTLLFFATSSFGSFAYAEPAATHNPMRAAGWAVVGIGGALGLGSVATGTFMYQNPAAPLEEQRVGGATLVGGVVTVAVSLIVGIPLIVAGAGAPQTTTAASSSGDAPDSKSRSATLARALAGEIRF